MVLSIIIIFIFLFIGVIFDVLGVAASVCNKSVFEEFYNKVYTLCAMPKEDKLLHEDIKNDKYESKNGVLYEDILDLVSGTNVLKNVSSVSELPSNLWKMFEPCSLNSQGMNDMLKFKGQQLKYYGKYTTINLYPCQLLKDKMGQCSSFANLFKCMLFSYGYPNEVTYITMSMDPLKYDGFFVKNWQILDLPSAVTDYRFLVSINEDEKGYSICEKEEKKIVETYTKNGYVSTVIVDCVDYEYVKDLMGEPGQNNQNPASDFGNHQFIKVGTVVYDPSYGVIYSQNAMDNLNSDINLKKSILNHIQAVYKMDEGYVKLFKVSDSDAESIGFEYYKY